MKIPLAAATASPSHRYYSISGTWEIVSDGKAGVKHDERIAAAILEIAEPGS